MTSYVDDTKILNSSKIAKTWLNLVRYFTKGLLCGQRKMIYQQIKEVNNIFYVKSPKRLFPHLWNQWQKTLSNITKPLKWTGNQILTYFVRHSEETLMQWNFWVLSAAKESCLISTRPVFIVIYFLRKSISPTKTYSYWILTNSFQRQRESELYYILNFVYTSTRTKINSTRLVVILVLEIRITNQHRSSSSSAIPKCGLAYSRNYLNRSFTTKLPR